LSYFVFVFSGLGVGIRLFPEKLIIPWLGVQIPPGPPFIVIIINDLQNMLAMGNSVKAGVKGVLPHI
jgi:hypothetical protein